MSHVVYLLLANPTLADVIGIALFALVFLCLFALLEWSRSA